MGRIADSIASAKVLVYDIETRPMCSFHWGARQQDISPKQVLDSGGMLCWSARWLHEKRIQFASDHHDGHEPMVERLWHLIDDADIVIGYNQVNFDDRRINVEFRRQGLQVPSPVRSVDLLKAVRARFGYPINKLEAVAAELGVGHKVTHTGWDLWRRCITDANGAPFLGPVPQGGGDPKAWATMKRYCRTDTELTTDVYYALRDGGWIKNHPHVGLFGGDLDGCPACGSGDLTSTGDVTTGISRFPLYRCGDCGAMSKGARRVGNVTGTRAV